MTAIEEDNREKVFELIGSDQDLLHMMTPFGTWLHIAASKGKLEVLMRLIELKADINRRGGLFDGAVNEAASEGHFITHFLIEYKFITQLTVKMNWL